jgi:hypothetical protein
VGKLDRAADGLLGGLVQLKSLLELVGTDDLGAALTNSTDTVHESLAE